MGLDFMRAARLHLASDDSQNNVPIGNDSNRDMTISCGFHHDWEAQMLVAHDLGGMRQIVPGRREDHITLTAFREFS